MSDDTLFNIIFKLNLGMENIKNSSREQLEEILRDIDNKNLRDSLREIINTRCAYLSTTDRDLAFDYLKFDFCLVTELAENYINCAEKGEKTKDKNEYYIQAINLFKRAYRNVKLTFVMEEDPSMKMLCIHTMPVLIGKEVAIEFCIKYNLSYKQIYPLIFEMQKAAGNHDFKKLDECHEKLSKLIPDFPAKSPFSRLDYS